MTGSVEDSIRKVVSENSGGLKISKLLIELMLEYGATMPSLEEIIDTIDSNMPDIGVFRYAWKMSEDTSREKLFVYEIPVIEKE